MSTFTYDHVYLRLHIFMTLDSVVLMRFSLMTATPNAGVGNCCLPELTAEIWAALASHCCKAALVNWLTGIESNEIGIQE